jgi:very-short-patch-repair endonuclease
VEPEESRGGQATWSSLLRAGIERFRSKLLDLSMSNRLLNFKHSEKSRSHIRIIDEVPEILFEKLDQSNGLEVKGIPEPDFEPEDEQTTQFREAFAHARETDELYHEQKEKLGTRVTKRQINKLDRELRDRVREILGLPPRIKLTVAERARELGFDPTYELPTGQPPTNRRQSSATLQTLFYRDDLETKLASIRESDRTLLEDAGINALYAAFGFVEWYESADSEIAAYAPLIFYPVEIKRTLEGGSYKYFLAARDDDIETNHAFAELIRANFGLELPEWTPEQTAAGYFEQVHSLLLRHRRWRLKRWVTVGLFTFAKLVMYSDLDPRRWSKKSGLENHPILSDLLLGASSVSEVAFAPDYEIDSPQVGSDSHALITDADSSQHSAVIDVLNGKNMVIQGPPGTGKSQTITNIIATAMNSGKTVLFIAEKMAALQVVKDRLDHFGLGHFCLEVHSNKTRKTVVLKSLEERLSFQGPPLDRTQLRQAQAAHEQARADLLNYVARTKEIYEETGLSVLDVLRGNAIRANTAGLPTDVLKVRIDNPGLLNGFLRAEINENAKNLEAAASRLGPGRGIQQHPWYGLQNSDLDVFKSEELLSLLQQWQESLDKLEQLVASVSSNCGWPIETTEFGVASFVGKASVVPSIPKVLSKEAMLKAMALSNRGLLSATVADLERLIYCRDQLGKISVDTDALFELGSAYLKNVSERARGQGLLELNEASVGQLTIELENKADAVHKIAGAGTALGQIVGLSDPKMSDASDMITAASLLQSLPRRIWSFRDPSVLNGDSLKGLERGLRDSESLLRSRAHQSELFELSLVPDAAIVKDAAYTLMTSSLLQRIFGSDHRAANRLYRGVAKKTRHQKEEKPAKDLASLAAFLQQEIDFERDSDLKRAAGKFFNGQKTPWRDLAAISAWAVQVRQSIPDRDGKGNDVQKFLLAASADKLEALHAFVQVPECSLLKRLQVDQPIDTDILLSEWSSASRTVAMKTRGLAVDLKRVRLKADVPLNALEPIADRLKEIEDIMRRLGQYGVLEYSGKGADALGISFQSLTATFQFNAELEAADLPRGILAKIQRSPDPEFINLLKTYGLELDRALRESRTLREQVCEIGRLNFEQWIGLGNWGATSIPLLIRRIQFARANSESLQLFLDFLRIEVHAKTTALAPLIEASQQLDSSYEWISKAFDFVFYRSCAEKLLNEDRKLASHSGASHEQLRKRYQQLDRKILELRRDQIARILLDLPIEPGVNRGKPSDFSDLALVRRQIAMQKRHLSLRELFRRAGTAVQALKPCFMMSPMSVAQFLDPAGLRFDLVVMDEASQVRPEDAIGGIARGSQVVIVGDPMQLPPSSFFEKVDRDEVLDDGSDEAEVQDLVGQESILDLARAPYQPIRELRWHYRSQHETLIAFSNQEFYEDSLIVFPSPRGTDEHFGVKLVHVEGIYDRSLNKIEAEMLVNAAQAFMRQFPDRSLGIVSINKPQQELIQTMMDDLYASDPSAESYRSKWEGTLESTFVKNLENVQGDERDVIFISTVYGKDAKGTFHQRLGPINGIYGHRRLNVLFTRAKQQVQLFTSMRSSDLRLDNTTKLGVKALKNYLSYCSDGHFETGMIGDREPDSEFERWVMRSLIEKGYEVVPQLGVAGYFVDLAVRHPEKRGSFILGVECDGASYHSARSARDRDRLRQEALVRLRWKIYRIWSTDWFRNPVAEFQKLVSAIEELRKESIS